MGLEVGEVGDVGGEVLAPETTESQWTRVAARGNVGGFAADPVRGGDLPDRAAYVRGVEQALCRAPDPVAVPVELEGCDPVDGLPAAFRADAVVALGGGDEPVVHQLLEDVGVHSGVGVPLGVAVPVGVGEDAGLVEGHQVGHLGASFGGDDRDDEVGQRTHPSPVGDSDVLVRLRAFGFVQGRGRSFSLAGSVVGKRSRTRCCWRRITSAVSPQMGRRRPSR